MPKHHQGLDAALAKHLIELAVEDALALSLELVKAMTFAGTSTELKRFAKMAGL